MPLSRPSNRKPDLPPEGGREIVRQQFGGVSPQSPDFCCPDGFDGIDQLAVISRLAVTILFLFEVVGNVFLEMRQLSIRDKDIGEGPVALVTNTEKLNPLASIRQALERQLNIRLTGKLDLQAKATFQLQFPLNSHRLCHSRLQDLDLCSEGRTLLRPRQGRYVLRWATARRMCGKPDGL
ncbi:hypothetical protein ACVTTK_18390 [Alcaligenes nematophilus]|uniref:hypothetical protein n=1 Tax=Alcaligenes faecalis TaxID=511 RepID=UPI001C0E5D77|nr:hypothetical protein [Alcaligenes faecalis]